MIVVTPAFSDEKVVDFVRVLPVMHGLRLGKKLISACCSVCIITNR
jgi:hypothetical protein